MPSHTLITILQNHMDRILSVVRDHTNLIERIIGRLEVIEARLDGDPPRRKAPKKKTAPFRVIKFNKEV